jgi:hypothetical protein
MTAHSFHRASASLLTFADVKSPSADLSKLNARTATQQKLTLPGVPDDSEKLPQGKKSDNTIWHRDFLLGIAAIDINIVS